MRYVQEGRNLLRMTVVLSLVEESGWASHGAMSLLRGKCTGTAEVLHLKRWKVVVKVHLKERVELQPFPYGTERKTTRSAPFVFSAPDS